ncbi:MAG: RsmD family RNA methyltransferase [Rubripirellula sp.]
MKSNRNTRRSGGGDSSKSSGKARSKSSGKAKTASPTKLRIIGGDMRGRIIHYHGAEFTRPMKDNIRENLFNILGRAAKGAICFDLFAGTGAMGFESLSRGATSAVLVEQNRQAVKYIHKTAESIGIEDRIRVVTGDTFRLASALLAPPQEDTPWIVFLCPPYVLWEESLDELNRIIQMTLDHAPPGSVLVAETEKRFDPAKLPAGEWDLREYGGTRLAFIEPAMKCGMSL